MKKVAKTGVTKGAGTGRKTSTSTAAYLKEEVIFMAARRVSFSKGRGKLSHNNRTMISANVDKERIKDNVTLVQKPLDIAYKDLFAAAVDKYNATQAREERKITDYFEKLFGCKVSETRGEIVQNKNKQSSFYEYVVGIGDRNDTGFATNPKAAKIAVIALEIYIYGDTEHGIESFSKRNKNLELFNAVIHCDETTPHLHFDVIPYWDKPTEQEGQKRSYGMTRQLGMSKALEQMGYGTGKDAYRAFLRAERDIFRKICELNGFEVAEEEKGRGYTYTTQELREGKLEAVNELKQINQQISEKKQEQLQTLIPPPRPTKPAEPEKPDFWGATTDRSAVKKHNKKVAIYNKEMGKYNRDVIPKWQNECKEWDKKWLPVIDLMEKEKQVEKQRAKYEEGIRDIQTKSTEIDNRAEQIAQKEREVSCHVEQMARAKLEKSEKYEKFRANKSKSTEWISKRNKIIQTANERNANVYEDNTSLSDKDSRTTPVPPKEYGNI